MFLRYCLIVYLATMSKILISYSLKLTGETETAQKISPQYLKALEKMAVGNPSLLNAFKESQSKLNVQDNFTPQK